MESYGFDGLMRGEFVGARLLKALEFFALVGADDEVASRESVTERVFGRREPWLPESRGR